MNTIWNPSVAELYKNGILEENLEVSSTGALLAYSGEKTGRSPKDKRIVYDEKTKDVWFGETSPNIPITKELFEYYSFKAKEYLESKDKIYMIDTYAGWDLPEHNNRIKIRIYCTLAYHALFMKNMLIPSNEKFKDQEVDFTIYNVGEISLKNYIPLDKKRRDLSLHDTLVGIDFTANEMVIYGTKYAGEMKKGVLTLMMYLMPIKDNLTLHSSANLDPNTNQLCLFFGLSGTGKTTLSADNERSLIGDDEHVWTNSGVFNIEGGCYAKCIGLKEEYEPEIYNAIKYGSVVENVVHDKDNVIDFEDGSITQNTRCSYPLNFIPNALIPATVDIHPKNIVFLTCDATGILPPVARLNPDQAVYFFVNGYTSKIPGTEVGITEPVATFSSCFGEPFLVWHPLKYGRLLKEKILEHNVDVWMLNTGWIKGSFNDPRSHRISIKDTRTLLDHIHNGVMKEQEFEKLPLFRIDIPKDCPGVNKEILNPINVWSNDEEYIKALYKLYNEFENNYLNKIIV